MVAIPNRFRCRRLFQSNWPFFRVGYGFCKQKRIVSPFGNCVFRSNKHASQISLKETRITRRKLTKTYLLLVSNLQEKQNGMRFAEVVRERSSGKECAWLFFASVDGMQYLKCAPQWRSNPNRRLENNESPRLGYQSYWTFERREILQTKYVCLLGTNPTTRIGARWFIVRFYRFFLRGLGPRR